jgi:transposase-like protein
MSDWKCERCNKSLDLENAVTISHGSVARWNLAVLCEPCADELLAAQQIEETHKFTPSGPASV